MLRLTDLKTEKNSVKIIELTRALEESKNSINHLIEEAFKKSSLDIQKTVNQTLEERMTKKESENEQKSQTLEQRL